MYRRASDQRVAQGKTSGIRCLPMVIVLRCRRLMSPLSLDDRDLRDLGRLSGMTSWSFEILMEHNNEVMQCKFNEVDESRFDRFASVGHATCRY